MTDTTERLVRAEAAESAFQQFIGPALTVMRDEYLAKLRDLASTRAMVGEPLAMVEKLSTALKVIDQVEIQIRTLIADGTAAKAEADHAGDIARLSPEQRRYAAY